MRLPRECRTSAAAATLCFVASMGCTATPTLTPSAEPSRTAGPSPTSASAAPTFSPTPTPSAIPSPTASALGAGFRFSTYGTYDPGPAYWVSVGQQMADRFEGARPQAIWIVGNFAGTGTLLTFPGSHEDRRISFSMVDKNEAALTLFDEQGVDVWLQVEPGDAPVEELIHVMLEHYGHHPSVIGVGVDVEWFQSDGTPEGVAVSDEEAAAWVAAARSHGSAYRLFLKHWETSKMPPTERDGIVFVDDSQGFGSQADMVGEFADWGEAFPDSPVAFQFGYPDDRDWWVDLDDPPGVIGDAIIDAVPNAAGLYWVDFTVREVFPPA